MRKIAIFVSGEGAATERIVNLFNEGNRLKTVLVIASDSGKEVLRHLENKDVTLLHIPDFEWTHRSREVEDLLRDNEVNLLVIDKFEAPLSEEILATTGGKVVKVTTPEQAPREVVAELEAHLRRPNEEIVPPAPEKNENPSPEEEWADSLKIRFTPPKVPATPPEVPGASEEPQQNRPVFTPPLPGGYPRPEGYPPHDAFPGNAPYSGPEGRPGYQKREPGRGEQEPMPSTYLIWSVLSTIFCCFIPGIIAIIFSSQVSGKYYGGDIEGARRASRMAEIWIIVSVVIGVVSATLYVPFMLFG